MPIYTLAQLRETAPEDQKGLSDEALVVAYSRDTNQDPMQVAKYLGVKTGADRGDFAAGVSAGIDSLQSIGISAAAGLADIVGAEGTAESLRGAAQEQQYEAYLAGKPELERIQDVEGVGGYIDWAQYNLGRQLPIMAGVAGAQFIPGLGQAATATGLARLGALAPRALGGASLRAGADFAARRAALAQGTALAKSTMVGTGLGFGSLYESSAADGDPDPLKALALAPLYGLAEAAVPASILRGLRMKGGAFEGNLPTRLAKAGGMAGVTEAGTELVQTEMELSLDESLSPEDRESARINAALAGAVVGGTYGSLGGLRGGPKKGVIELDGGGLEDTSIRENELNEKDLAPTSAPMPTEQAQIDLESTMFPQEYDEAGVPETRPIPTGTQQEEEFSLLEPLSTEPVQPEEIAPATAVAEGQEQIEFADERTTFIETLKEQAKGRALPQERRKIIEGQLSRLRKDLAELAGGKRPKDARLKEIQDKAAERLVGQIAVLEEQLNTDNARSEALRKTVSFGTALEKLNTEDINNVTVKKDQELTEEDLAILAEGAPNIAAQLKPKSVTVAPIETVYTQEAIDRAKRETGRKGRSVVVNMPIDEFLSLALEGEEAGKTEALKDVSKFDQIVTLNTESQGGVAKITSHEGRHRARRMKEMGFDTIPVKITDKFIRFSEQTEGNPDFEENFPTRLLSETGEYETAFPVTQGQSGFVTTQAAATVEQKATPTDTTTVEEKLASVEQQAAMDAEDFAEVGLSATELLQLETEIQKINESQGKLAAEVGGERSKAKGKVSLPTPVLQGLARMVLSPQDAPVGFAYRPRTATIDRDMTAQYTEQMSRIHRAVMEVLATASEYNNTAANIVKNQKQKDGAKQVSVAKDEKINKLTRLGTTLQNKLEALEQAAGGVKNVEAVVAAIKARRERGKPNTVFDASKFAISSSRMRKTGKPIKSAKENAEIIDTLLSSSFQRYLADAVTDQTYIRPTPTRNLGEKGKTPIVKAYEKDGLEGILFYVGSYIGTTSTYGTVLGSSLRQAIRALDAQIAPQKISVEFYGPNEKGTPYYDPATTTIKINQNASQEEIMHETLHAALQAYVYNNQDTAEVNALKSSLKDLFDYMDNADLSTVPQESLARAVTSKIRALYDAGNEMDAVLELISYGNTLNEFRTLLKTIPTSTNNATKDFSSKLGAILGRVLSVIRTFLGVTDTVANVVLEGSVSLLARVSNSKVDMRTPVGGRLYMAVNSGQLGDMNPVGPNNVVLGEAIRGSSVDKRDTMSLLTRPLFEAIGWAKGVEQLGKIATNARNLIIEKYPRAEMAVKWFNASFGLSENVVDQAKRLSETINGSSIVAEAVSDYFSKEATVKEQKAILKYLDGDKTALDGRELRRAKAIAEALEKLYNNMVDSLEDPVAIEHFSGKKFTEVLIFPDNDKTIASSSFGTAKLSKMIKSSGVKVEAIDIDDFARMGFLDLDENGNPDLSGSFYQLTLKDVANNTYHAFISKNKFDANADLARGLNADTSREWRLLKSPGQQDYRAVSKITYGDAVEIKNARRIGIAISNTMHALSANIASTNWIRNIANQPDTVFDDVAAVEAYLNKDVTDDSKRVHVPQEKVVPIAMAVKKAGLRNQLSVTGSWVKFGDDVKQYGELAGKIVPGPVWKSLYDASNRESIMRSVPLWDAANRRFKKSKTVYNPGTQITNVASNVTFMITNDIPLSMLPRAAKMLAKFESNSDKLTDSEVEIMKAFYLSGAQIGSFSQSEVKQELYDEVVKNAAVKKGDSIVDTVTAMLGIQSFSNEFMNKAVQKGSEIDDVAVQLYAAGDNMFRLAAFIKSLDDQMSVANAVEPTDDMISAAGAFARKSFLDYNIDAPFLKIARSSFMPFLSWTYAAIPQVARTVATKPWKIANIAIAYSLVDMLASSLAGDDDEMRKLGPERLNQRVFGFGPRVHIRIPFLGDDQNPVYYRLGEYLPLQSTFSPGFKPFAGLDWMPQGLTPGGPAIAALTAIFTGQDPVTGRELHKLEESDFEKIGNIGGVILDQFLPSALSGTSRGKYADVLMGNTSFTGLEPDLMHVVMGRLLGLKTVNFNVNEQQSIKDIENTKLARDYSAAISRLRREELRKGYPDFAALEADIAELRVEMLERYKEIYGLDEE